MFNLPKVNVYVFHANSWECFAQYNWIYNGRINSNNNTAVYIIYLARNVFASHTDHTSHISQLTIRHLLNYWISQTWVHYSVSYKSVSILDKNVL